MSWDVSLNSAGPADLEKGMGTVAELKAILRSNGWVLTCEHQSNLFFEAAFSRGELTFSELGETLAREARVRQAKERIAEVEAIGRDRNPEAYWKAFREVMEFINPKRAVEELFRPVPENNYVACINLNFRGSEDPLRDIVVLCKAVGWTAYDTGSMCPIDLDNSDRSSR